MGIVIKKRTLFQILLGLCFAVPYLSNYELTFVLWSFTAVISIKRRYSIIFLKYISCFFMIFLIALFTTDFGKANLFFIIRDITYLMKPVLGLFLGYQLCRYLYKNVFETLLYCGLGIAIIHIAIILKTFLIYQGISVALLRQYCGYFSDFEVYILVLVLFYKQFNIDISRKTFYIMAFTIGFSAFMYLSRTNIIQFVILFLAMRGYFLLNKKAIIAISSVIILAVGFYAVVLAINPKRTGSSLDEFLYKIKVAPTEPFKTKVNITDYIDFNLNYRSLEMIFTLEQVRANGTKAILLGSGLGSQIDLKQEVYLGDMNLRYISVLHNGFMTTYLKSGILGVLILMLSIIMLFRQKRSTIPINRQLNFLLVGTSIFLLVSNWVLMGYYFTQDSKSILVGLFFAYKEITNAKESAGTLN